MGKAGEQTSELRRFLLQVNKCLLGNRYLNPLYYGDYLEVMCEILGVWLPKFLEEDKDLLKNSIDFIGLNHYTSRLTAHVTDSLEESYFYKAQAMINGKMAIRLATR